MSTVTVEITRNAPYRHVVPGTYTPAGSESFELTELHIGNEIVGVEIHGEVYDPCKRCVVGGHYSFNGVDSICYGCHGYSHGKATTEDDIVRRYIARQKAAERRERQAREAAEKQAAELRAWEELHADIAEALKAHRSPVDPEGYADFSFTPKDRFLTSLADQATYKPLSEKQTAAAVAAFARLREQDEKRAARDGIKIAAGHWGEVKKRDTVVVTVNKIIVIDGEWGATFLVIMTSAEGHSLKTFASGGSAFVTDAIEAEKDGQPLKIKATVKEHGEYNGVPQTMLTRCATLPG